MELFSIIGYLIGFLVGVIMGLIGGGGSLLLPTLVYLLDRETTLATAYTLVLIGVTAVVGVIPRIKEGTVDFPTAITLGVPILVGTLVVRAWLTHLVPDFVVDAAGHETDVPFVLFQLGGYDVTKKMLVLVVFAIVLLFSFASMMGWIGGNLKARPEFRTENPRGYYAVLIGAGLFIGVLSSFIGAGGGVMIVPLLVIVFGLPMKTVVGTSLAIMAGKSTIGFVGDIYKIGDKIEWGFLSGFAGVMIAGIIIGSYLSNFVSGEKLKKGFAWFILALSIFILIRELFLPEM